MTKYLLDTCVCVDLLRGNKEILKKTLNNEDNLYISEVSLLELKYGALKSNRQEENLEKIQRLSSLFNVVKFGDTIDTFCREKNELRKQGILIEDFDLLIASAAIFIDATLVSNNAKHMARINSIKLENWNIL